MSDPRVLHVITGLASGGAEWQLAALLRHLPGQHDVLTLTNAGLVAEQIVRDGGRVIDLGMRGNRDLSALPRLVRHIRAGRYDVVHTHLYRACVYGRLAARLAGVRAVVATEHSLGDVLMEGRPLTDGVRRLYLATERLGSMTIAVSPTVARRLTSMGVSAERVVVAPNGIDALRYAYSSAGRERARAELGIAPGELVVGGVSRLAPTKRFDVLLRAVRELPEATVLLVGDGPARPDLAELARELDMAERVRFTGEVAEVPDLLSAMDVYAAPSPEETFGLGVLEALANGLPVVYVACPAVEDMPARLAESARRVPLEPAPMRAALAEALERVRAGLDRHAVAPLVDHYDVAALAARLTAIYRGVLAGRAAGRPPAPAEAATPTPRVPAWTAVSTSRTPGASNEHVSRGNEDV